MTREFPEELFSAFLDDELTDADREKVQNHLATSEQDRRLVAEIQALRGEVASLPRADFAADFADRVLAAAMEEAEKNGMAVGPLAVPESAKVEPTASSNGSAAAVLPEPGFTGILAADADTE